MQAIIRTKAGKDFTTMRVEDIFDQAAKKNKVQIIGQVTGANGALLQKAIDFIQQNFVWRTHLTRTADIAANGLGKNDVGRVIVF